MGAPFFHIMPLLIRKRDLALVEELILTVQEGDDID
jgi:hypothetical protein